MLRSAKVDMLIDAECVSCGEFIPRDLFAQTVDVTVTIFELAIEDGCDAWCVFFRRDGLAQPHQVNTRRQHGAFNGVERGECRVLCDVDVYGFVGGGPGIVNDNDDEFPGFTLVVTIEGNDAFYLFMVVKLLPFFIGLGRDHAGVGAGENEFALFAMNLRKCEIDVFGGSAAEYVQMGCCRGRLRRRVNKTGCP
ncbi:hypothetical protein D3C76_1141220 [compost metagenome]